MTHIDLKLILKKK